MSTYRYTDRVCVGIVVFAVLITSLFTGAAASGTLAVSGSGDRGYVSRLFDSSRVHSIEIEMEDWEAFVAGCENEEYEECAVVIDGQACYNVGIRAKGNTSLSSVSAMGSDRYSFKLEFDHYDSARSYFGLDKLSLNNLIQDNTFMKDYLTYQMMGSFGVDAPLCSYAFLTVNGQDWGIYLAVEGVEEAFLQRNYGNDYGNLYKPDSSDFGGGPGNGRDFRMEEFMESGPDSEGSLSGKDSEPQGGFPGEMPDPEGGFMEEGVISGDRFAPEGAASEQAAPEGGSAKTQEMPEKTEERRGRPFGEMPEFAEASQDGAFVGFGEMPESGEMPEPGKERPGGMPPGPMGMGSSDVKLQYIDDDPESYPNIFENAKTDIGKKDQSRLISSLKDLSEGVDLERVVNVEEVIRYFVVHNFVCNGDSYTGSIVHNYYLYEKDGQLSMIPWDYNLAFGTFQSSDATAMVNSPIDTPVGSMWEEERPMVDWIFDREEYTQQYHRYFADFLENTDFDGLIDTTASLIAPYVERDPTKFCTYEEFETGVEALKEFCRLRAESVEGQLGGEIPATTSAQEENSGALVDASHLTLSDMGTMENGMRGRKDFP